jgi:glycosyltransferase involved in cell wall biosynthesis
MIKVLIKGPVLSRSGYGEHTRYMFRALSTRPDLFDLYVEPTNWGQSSWNLDSSQETKQIESCIEKLAHFQGKFDVSLQVLIPNEWQNLAEKNIGVTAAIETTHASAQWIHHSNFMDKILVTSEHAKNSLKNPTHQVTADDGSQHIIKLQKPISVVSYPFRDIVEDTTSFDKIKLDTKFNFLTCAQVGPRKNLMNTIRWFVEEFKDEEDMGLVVKAHQMNNSVIDRNKVRMLLSQAVHGVPHRKCRVFLVHGNMTDEEMNSLYKHPNIHAYATITHGEGFGLPIFEAACSGMPVVAPAWSGQVDFLYDEIKNKTSGRVKRTPMFTKVKYKLDTVPKEAVWENVIEADSKWCYPDEAAYKKALRGTVEAFKSRKSTAKKLQKSLKERLDQNKMFEKVVEEVLEVYPKDVAELEDFLDGLSSEIQVHD